MFGNTFCYRPHQHIYNGKFIMLLSKSISNTKTIWGYDKTPLFMKKSNHIMAVNDIEKLQMTIRVLSVVTLKE